MGKYRRLIKRAVQSTEYWTRATIRGFARDLDARMEAQEMSRAALAEKVKVSPAYITKALRGEANFTIETMTKLAMAVGGRLNIRIEERSVALTENNLNAMHGYAIGRCVASRAERSDSLTLNAGYDAANDARFAELVRRGSLVNAVARTQ